MTRTQMTRLPWLIRITKTYLYNFDPLKPHFYWGLQGYTLFYLFLLKTQIVGAR